jgi:hypothetical protein
LTDDSSVYSVSTFTSKYLQCKRILEQGKNSEGETVLNCLGFHYFTEPYRF